MSLLLLAWPRLQASLHYLPVEAAIERYWIDGALPLERVPDLQRRSREAIAIQPHQRYWEGLGLLHYIEGLDKDASLNGKRQAFEQAVAATDESLRLAPVQPALWMRRADALNWLAFTSDPALNSFKMSVLSGRVEPMLQLSRLRLGYARLGALDEEGRALLRDQTLLAWQMRQGDVLSSVKRGELSLLRLRSMLASTHPDLLAEMEQALDPQR